MQCQLQNIDKDCLQVCLRVAVPAPAVEVHHHREGLVVGGHEGCRHVQAVHPGGLDTDQVIMNICPHVLHFTSPSSGSATVMSNLAERPGRGRDGEERPQPGLGRPPDEEDSEYKDGTHSCYEAACCADIIIKDLSSNG